MNRPQTASAWQAWLVEQCLRSAGLHPEQCVLCSHLRAGVKQGDPPFCAAGPINTKRHNLTGDCPDHEPLGADLMGWSK